MIDVVAIIHPLRVMEISKGEDDIQICPLLIQQQPEPGHPVPMLNTMYPPHFLGPTAVTEATQRLHVHIRLSIPNNIL